MCVCVCLQPLSWWSVGGVVVVGGSLVYMFNNRLEENKRRLEGSSFMILFNLLFLVSFTFSFSFFMQMKLPWFVQLQRSCSQQERHCWADPLHWSTHAQACQPQTRPSSQCSRCACCKTRFNSNCLVISMQGQVHAYLLWLHALPRRVP